MVTDRLAMAWEAAAAVADPELPFLTVADLGILRSVSEEGDRIVVTVTPTYSGCPAMREIMCDLRDRVDHAGLGPAEVRTALSPAWTSDWITPEGQRKLAEAGIAPPRPAPRRGEPVPLRLTPIRRRLECPNCGSVDTVEQSVFSGTACKALYRCGTCREPFEYVKEI